MRKACLGGIIMTEFPKNIHDKLKHYVYLYIDPRDNKIFYVGKGYGNRAFSHLFEESEKEKAKIINEIRNEGLSPKIEIVIHGIEDDQTARKIEASIIDIIGINNLSNLQRGYESKEFGRMSIEQIIATYESVKAIIDDPAIIININRSFHYGISQVELYDATRSAWVVGLNREKAKYAFSVYEGIVQEVYEIKGWFPNNSTLNTRKNEETDPREERWEFVGKIAPAIIRNKYIYKDVSDLMGPRNPISYVNC